MSDEINETISGQKPALEATVAYDIKNVSAYLRWSAFIPMLFCTIFGALLIIGGILLCIFVEPAESGMAVVLFGLVFVFIYSMPYAFAPTIAKNRANVKWHLKIKLVFGNDKIIGTEESGVSAPKGIEAQWYVFLKAVETKAYFYLFWDKRNALIIPKADIQNGTTDDLRTLLTEKLGSKMKPIKKINHAE